ncbi:P-loop NTPase fold protein [Robinsoniella sp. KNHs210]|uniref:KAP family P-loop NTPase fold protein n=1 Tax=Robinsoniella TaxID=588605 RepID=UPI0004896647|nr:P-loop NTPase fold protein [Robinsoniella sp. KNHs210]
MWLDKESPIDLLAYSPFAELITNITANERLNPLTIGLFGRWGAGKSTLLKLVEKNIDERDVTKKKFVCVSLNSWVFEGYDDAKSAIMESLLRALMDNQPAFEELKDDIKGLIGRINFMKLGAATIRHGMPLIMSAINPATATLTMAQYFSKTKRKEILDDIKQVWNEKEVEENKDTAVENIRLFRKEFSDLIDKSHIDNLIVMIDDLDRCTPERVIETLEAVKLFLSVPKSTFIIAVDSQVMKYSIENKYPKITEGSEDFSDSYIEKIIQLPINIPELSETDIKNYLLLLICELFLSKGVPSIKANQLEILLSKVKEANIFVDGVKIDLEFVKSAFEHYDDSVLECGTINEFERMFEIIAKTSDVIASTLKGNPRQAKRFLNSFLIRKNLAEIYYKTDKEFNYAILAKLMALEYIDTGRFKELYKWAVENQKNPKIKELESITSISRNDEELPEEYRKWSDEKIVRWLKSDPIDLYEKKLLKYFYLTRESLDINVSVSDSLGKVELTIFNKILQSKRATDYGRTVEKLKDNKEIKYTKILDALIEEFRKNCKLLEKMQPIYICYSDYRSEIKDVLKKMKITEINLQTATVLSSMYQVDKSGFSDVVESLKNKGLDQSIVEIIVKEK